MLAGAKAAIDTSPRATSSHPRAFGRTSNVWQYLNGFQDRLTPPNTFCREGSSRFTDQTHNHLSESQLDPLYDDGSDEVDADDDESELSRSDYAHQRHPSDGSSRSGSAGRRRRRESGKDKAERHRHYSTSSTRHSMTFADASRHRHASCSGLKNVVSLPELPAPGRVAGKKTSLQAATMSGGNNGSTSGSISVPNGTAGVPIWRRDRKAVGDKVKVNVAEVMRTLNALGTSASAPALPASSPVSVTLSASSQPMSPQQSLPSGGNSSPTIAAATVASMATTSAAAAATTAAVISDAEKLRNDFNSQRTRLSYGCSVALELFNGHVMMVGSPDGQVRVQSLEKLQALPQVKGYKDRAVFTLIDLLDPRSASSIRFGDAVWLQLSIGTGEASWEQGGVLGAKVREAPQLKALALSEGPSFFRNDAPAPAVVGHPVPIRAYLPKSRDDGDMQMDEIQSRVRNKASKMLGKWVVRSAVHSSRKQADNFVYNNDEIYLEQDWFYLGADSDAGVAVLRQLPSALSSSSIAANDVKDGEYVVERRAAWRVRLLDSSNGGAGLSLAQQQMERLLLRAKTQLKQSRKMRAGQTRVYAPGIHGGAGFPRQLRAQVGASVDQCDANYLSRQQMWLETLTGHLNEKAQAMNVGVQLRVPQATSSQRESILSDDEGRHADKRDGGTSTTREPASASSCQSTRRGSGWRRSVRTPPSAVVTTENGACDEGCALCHSSTMGINLCCQLRHVMRKLRDEVKEQQRTRRASFEDENDDTENVEGECDDHVSVDGANDVSCAGDDAHGDTSACASGSKSTASPAAMSPPSPSSSLVSTNRCLRSSGHASDVVNADPLVADPYQEERLRRLLATEDTAMTEIIRFKEKEEQEALAAEEQARIGLSPVAAQFRDRFKHVGLLAQAHHQRTHEPQHGIGGHFQRLHAELNAEAAQARKRNENGKEDADALTELDLSTCPFEYPPEVYDVYGRKIDGDAEDDDAGPRTRLFPTVDELDLLPPIETKKILDLYSQNWSAVLEMLEGFVELVDAHVVPSLHASMATLSRGALVEVLDFTARASEFVCAVRVQVRVAQLLHAISASEAGDFASFMPELELLLEELDGTAVFIRFFRERNANAKRKRRGN